MNSVSEVIETMQQYSYRYNAKIVGYPQASEVESLEDTAHLCLKLFTSMGLNDISFEDIDTTHRVPIRVHSASNKPQSIICKFVRRLVKDKVMAVRAGSNT